MQNVFAGGSDFICTYRYRQLLYDTEQYHCGIVGTGGVTAAPGERECEVFIEEIRKLRKHYAPRETKPIDYLARRIAILFNHENSQGVGRQEQNRTWDTFAHTEKYHRTLKSLGAPVDFVSEQRGLTEYPVVIVPTYQLADKELVNGWITYMRNGGNLVLTYRTAQKSRYGRLPEAPFGSMIIPLAGDEMNFYGLPLPEDPDTAVMNREQYAWNTQGGTLIPASDSRAWTTYANGFYEGNPAVTFRKLDKGTATYVGVDSHNGTLEKNILKKSYARLQVPVMDLPYGIMVEYRNGLGVVLSYSDRSYTFDIPEGSRVLVGAGEVPTAGVLVFSM